MIDLFEHSELWPENLSQVINFFALKGEFLSLEEVGAMLAECEAIGFTFDYGLDAIPYDLRPLLVNNQPSI